MNRTKQQLQRDIQFCRNVLGLTDEQTDQMIMVCDKLKIGAEYFSEEFVFEGDGLESIRHQQRGTANLIRCYDVLLHILLLQYKRSYNRQPR